MPYAAYSTHWVEPKALIRSTNGPPYYFYRYAVEQFTPLQFSGFAYDIGLENLDTKERFRAHVAAVYLGKNKHWFYVSKAHPEYFERMKKQQLKSSSDKQLWTEEEQQLFIEGCKGEGSIKGWSQKETDKFSDCVLEKLIEVIPDPTIYEGGNLPESIFHPIQLECYNIIKLNI